MTNYRPYRGFVKNAARDAAMSRLNEAQGNLSPQEYWTIRGQIKAGETDAAMRGLDKVLRRQAVEEDT